MSHLRELVFNERFGINKGCFVFFFICDFIGLSWAIKLHFRNKAVELLLCCGGVIPCCPVARLLSLVGSVIHDGICARHKLFWSNLKKRIFCTKLYLRCEHLPTWCIAPWNWTLIWVATRFYLTNFPGKIVFIEDKDGIIFSHLGT
jgi:hypothetical protein